MSNPQRMAILVQGNCADDLAKIHEYLQKHRNHENFVRSLKLPRVDFFIPSDGLIIEFDESQHFTHPREIALDNYPQGLKVGFSVERWRSLCQQLHCWTCILQ